MKLKAVFLLSLTVLALTPIASADVSENMILNAKAGYPQIVSGEVGWMFGKARGNEWSTEIKGAYASISPGIAGTKLSAGYAQLVSGMVGWAGIRYSATYLYMYDDVDRYEADSHYFGPEAHLSLLWFTANLGVLWSTDSGDSRIIAGIGIGF